jgi:hypothetical protein
MTAKKVAITPIVLALHFHEAYERLAPQFGYEKRTETRKFDLTSANGQLMIAVAAELLVWIEERSPTPTQQQPLTELRRMQIIGDEFPIALVQPIIIAKVDSVARAIERAHGIGVAKD